MNITIKNPEWVPQKLGARMPQSLVQVYLHAEVEAFIFDMDKNAE
jgi:hypothetical protein